MHVVCLHGFPDLPGTFELLRPVLEAAGHTVSCPRLPGYGGEAFDGSMASAVDWLDREVPGEVALVGHDWGAILAWSAAVRSRRVRRLVLMAVPPLAGLGRVWGGVPRQLWLSRYIVAFQRPGSVPDVAALWARWSPGFDGASWRDAAAAHLAEPSAREGALAWYRALVRGPRLGASWALMTGTPSVRAHGLTGADDGCIDTRVFDRAPLTVTRFEGCGHWLHLERPVVVGRAVLAALS